jgi:hypothetical protein
LSMTDQNQNPQPEDESDDLSIAGKGWDILVGGQENLAASGGEDPFDLTPRDNVIEMKALSDIAAEGATATDVSDLSPEEMKAMKTASPAPPQLIAEKGLPDLSPEQLNNLTDEALQKAAAPLLTEVGEDLEAPPEETGALTPLDMDELTGEPTIEDEGDKVAQLFDELSESGTPPPEAPSKAELMGVEPRRVGPQNAPTVIEAMGPSGFFSTDRDDVPIASPHADIAKEELQPNEDIANMLVTPERISALWGEIDKLYDTVVEDVRGDYKSTEKSLADLQRAREFLLAGRNYFDEAEELIMAVRARLRLEEKVQTWSRKYGTLIGIYLVIWLVGMSAFSLIIAPLQDAITVQYGVTEFLAGTILPGLFGGLGGVVGAIWVLIKHTARERNFDPLHRSWYFFNPLMGVALGVLTYILSYGGGLLFSIGTGTAAFDPSESVAVYGICAIVGFRQNVFWKLIERVAGGVFGSDDDDNTAERSNTLGE